MISGTKKYFGLCAVFLVTSACGNGPPPATPANAATPAPQTPGTAALPATFADQVLSGQKLYGEHCASCHGDGGEGKSAPAVVGLDKGALPLEPPAGAKFRKTEFKTVADVAAFAVESMPADAPGTLTEPQYWSILAFDLKANGINLDKPLDGALAATLTIPRH
jgi:mono/diheme cytochrome c family protein